MNETITVVLDSENAQRNVEIVQKFLDCTGHTAWTVRVSCCQ